jgi:hypothetical protein
MIVIVEDFEHKLQKLFLIEVLLFSKNSYIIFNGIMKRVFGPLGITIFIVLITIAVLAWAVLKLKVN